MKINQILSTLEAVVANANIFSVRPRENLAETEAFDRTFNQLAKTKEAELAKMIEYSGLSCATAYIEFELSFHVSCQLQIKARPVAKRVSGKSLPALKFDATVSWPSCGSTDVQTAATQISLFTDVVKLAQRIEALAPFEVEQVKA